MGNGFVLRLNLKIELNSWCREHTVNKSVSGAYYRYNLLMGFN
jgi:hypothetical protein